jgi:hypothetical protein
MEIFVGGEGTGGGKELGPLLLFNPLCGRPRGGRENYVKLICRFFLQRLHKIIIIA